jgi:hypothetical protein
LTGLLHLRIEFAECDSPFFILYKVNGLTNAPCTGTVVQATVQPYRNILKTCNRTPMGCLASFYQTNDWFQKAGEILAKAGDVELLGITVLYASDTFAEIISISLAGL